MGLSVCLLLDDPADTAVRRLWRRLEDAGVPTLLTHTHGHHVPHLSLASLPEFDLDAVREALVALPVAEPSVLYLDGMGMFRRSRCWLLPAVTADLLARQQRVAAAAGATGAQLHRNYVPGGWLPHLTVAPRLHLDDLPTVARAVFEILPLTAAVSRAALVETGTGRMHPLPHLL